MKFSDNAMSAVLLCSYIGLQDDKELKPLSLGEWNALQDRLVQFGEEPGALLAHPSEILQDKGFESKYIERIQRLVTRGNAAFALDDLMKKGIGVITQFDPEYPKLLKIKLKKKKPPVLFYAGDIQLANKIGVAVVGSRNVDQAGMDFTRKLAEKASNEKLVIYSGGAKGVDTISEQTAIHSGGAVVAFLADSLLARIKKKDALDSIMQRQLLLLTDVKPDLGFTAPRAMSRNKYIYASAYGAFVVSSDYKKGGTWSGATDAIRNDWTKVFVWNHPEYDGNQKLLGKGGIPYELSEDKLYDIITKKEEKLKYNQIDIFSMSQLTIIESAEKQSSEEAVTGSATIESEGQQSSEEAAAGSAAIESEGQQSSEEAAVGSAAIESEGQQSSEEAAAGSAAIESAQALDTDGAMQDLYDCVKPFIMERFDHEMNLSAASAYFHVAKGQMKVWLTRLCDEGRLQCKKGVYAVQKKSK